MDEGLKEALSHLTDAPAESPAVLQDDQPPQLTAKGRRPEEVFEEGRLDRDVSDATRWRHGARLDELQSVYGQDTVGTYAKEVGLAKKTCQEYERMYQFYPDPARSDFIAELGHILYYAHFRLAKRLKAYDTAIEFLEEVAMHRWTVDEAEYHLLTDEPWKSIVNPKKVTDEPEDEAPEGTVITEGRVTLANLYSPAPGKFCALFEFDLETYSALMAIYSQDDQPVEWTVREAS